MSLRTEAWRAAGVQAQAFPSCQGEPQPPAPGDGMLDVGPGTDVPPSFRCPIFPVLCDCVKRSPRGRKQAFIALGEPGLGVAVSGVTSPRPRPRGRGLERRQTRCSFLSAGRALPAQELTCRPPSWLLQRGHTPAPPSLPQSPEPLVPRGKGSCACLCFPRGERWMKTDTPTSWRPQGFSARGAHRLAQGQLVGGLTGTFVLEERGGSAGLATPSLGVMSLQGCCWVSSCPGPLGAPLFPWLSP